MEELTRVLIVEDDHDVREATAEYLSSRAFAVETAESGEAVRTALAKSMPDVVLLDLGLPGEDGLGVARYLRERHDVAIIMVTGASDVVDRVVGLELGADDYVAKPFEMRELLARINSVLRRTRRSDAVRAHAPAPRANAVRLGECTLDLSAHRLLGAAGDEIPITSMEFGLLRAFTEHPNQVLSRDRLLTLTRNREWEPFDRSIDIRIARLRRKIERDPARPAIIKTVRGTGYLYAPGTGQ
jgi:two-component system phosphate regulon response regulator OmpR